MTRPTFFAPVLLLAAVTLAPAQDRCAGSRDLRLVNGKIVTMDARNSTCPL